MKKGDVVYCDVLRDGEVSGRRVKVEVRQVKPTNGSVRVKDLSGRVPARFLWVQSHYLHQEDGVAA